MSFGSGQASPAVAMGTGRLTTVASSAVSSAPITSRAGTSRRAIPRLPRTAEYRWRRSSPPAKLSGVVPEALTPRSIYSSAYGSDGGRTSLKGGILVGSVGWVGALLGARPEDLDPVDPVAIGRQRHA